MCTWLWSCFLLFNILSRALTYNWNIKNHYFWSSCNIPPALYLTSPLMSQHRNECCHFLIVGCLSCFSHCTLINNAGMKPFNRASLTVTLNILSGRIPRRDTTGTAGEFFLFKRLGRKWLVTRCHDSWFVEPITDRGLAVQLMIILALPSTWWQFLRWR